MCFVYQDVDESLLRDDEVKNYFCDKNFEGKADLG